MWSLAVTLWEVSNLGTERPFDAVADNGFVAFAVAQPLTLANMLGDIRIQVRSCISRDYRLLGVGHSFWQKTSFG